MAAGSIIPIPRAAICGTGPATARARRATRWRPCPRCRARRGRGSRPAPPRRLPGRRPIRPPRRWRRRFPVAAAGCGAATIFGFGALNMPPMRFTSGCGGRTVPEAAGPAPPGRSRAREVGQGGSSRRTQLGRWQGRFYSACWAQVKIIFLLPSRRAQGAEKAEGRQGEGRIGAQDSAAERDAGEGREGREQASARSSRQEGAEHDEAGAPIEARQVDIRAAGRAGPPQGGPTRGRAPSSPPGPPTPRNSGGSRAAGDAARAARCRLRPRRR